MFAIGFRSCSKAMTLPSPNIIHRLLSTVVTKLLCFLQTFFFLFLQTSYKKVSFVINLNPIEELFQSVEDELEMKYVTLKEGTKGVINAPLEGDFSKGQLISKCPFGVFVSTKIPTKKFDNFCPRI